MHYVSAENISKSYGIKQLFENITFHISEGDKIALVARNGTGKSTLLKILAGKDNVESGTVWIHKDVTVALFDQDPQFEEDLTVLDNIFHYKHPVSEALRKYERAMDSAEQDPTEIGEALALIDELGAWEFEGKVKEILGKLNIHNLDQKVKSLSGGQRKRVALAQTLIDIGFEHKHVLLIMDEPTNHLDVEMVEWLEHYLNQEKVTLLMVTHDRYFLEDVCDEIWELDDNKIYTYKGDYANFLEKKAARIDNQLANIDKAKNLYRKELEWMRKQPKARTTKSKSRQDSFYETEAKAKQKVVDLQVKLEMQMNRLGGKIAELKKVYKSYGDKVILRGFDYTFKKGERVGIIGKNGAGKSTFLQMLQGLEMPDSGKINIGDTIIFGNFSQQGLEIKEDMRVIEYVKNIAEHFPLAGGGSISASQFLTLFLFPPEQQFTYVSKLSGGEKKRLQLLAVLFRNPNFLILDEPTNDLDLPTLSVLENFLSDYQGCLLIVSHDRYFMDRLVDHLFVFDGEGVVNDFPGNYSEYRLSLKSKEKTGTQLSGESKPETAEPEVATKPKEAEKKKFSFKEKREFEMLEKDMATLETEKTTITAKMADASLPYDELLKLGNRITEITGILEEKELRWLELSEYTS
ncbi:ABC transporter [Flavipsychrobacter stenotrophus]|uniref:ABC transporter n=1 Tax=Flavipsychrobacter stenotrophus TaxID=2077091 RepID=A0A2S7SRP9_9BACT|nr:ABC-F family ATP-binding cassette domain-containing protein [Flavipsychrobacter stenotrophus]PQJ09287.1 ABC transporter [Flavipsychrobacter stenotrophus]